MSASDAESDGNRAQKLMVAVEMVAVEQAKRRCESTAGRKVVVRTEIGVATLWSS